MYIENANRSIKDGSITVDNLEPISKNPIIAAFFRNIGYADQLGSGVRKLLNIVNFILEASRNLLKVMCLKLLFH